MTDFDGTPTQKMLADISMCMADGSHFLELRTIVESVEEDDTVDSRPLMTMIEQYHRLCLMAMKR